MCVTVICTAVINGSDRHGSFGDGKGAGLIGNGIVALSSFTSWSDSVLADILAFLTAYGIGNGIVAYRSGYGRRIRCRIIRIVIIDLRSIIGLYGNRLGSYS